MKSKIGLISSWCFWLVGVWFLLLPAIKTQPVGDDLINPFFQHYETGAGFLNTLRLGIEYGTSHKFDIVGQLAFVIHSWLWLQIDNLFGWNHLTFYFLTKWIIFALGIGSAASLLRTVFRYSGLDVPRIVAAWIVALALASTIQIHAVWSNDPVANYPLSGYASAAIGIFALNYVAKSLSNATALTRFVASAVVSMSILYYQINTVLIIATIPLALIAYKNSILIESSQKFLQILKIGIGYYALPVATVVWGRWITVGDTDNYGGTTVGSLSQFPKTTAISLLSSLPAGGWNLSFEVYERSSFSIASYGLFFLSFLVGTIVVIRSLRVSPDTSIQLNWAVIASVLSLVLYWIGSTSIQTITDKYQDEIVRIGQIYNFYAQASLVIAVLLAMCFLVVRQNFTSVVVGILCAFAFGSVQYSINSSLEEAIRVGNGASRSVVNAYSDTSTDKQRCEAWAAWAAGSWPTYYEQGLSAGLSLAYQHFFETKFCSQGTPVVP